MAVAACIELTIGTYHFICSTWVLNWTDKSLIEYDPSMNNKNLCCRLLKRLYRSISEQVVHGGVGKMGFFSGFGYLVGGLEVWRLCVLRVIVNYDVTFHVTYIKSSSVVHLFPLFFFPSSFFSLPLPILSFYSHYST